jgi:DNA adenine methylase
MERFDLRSDRFVSWTLKERRERLSNTKVGRKHLARQRSGFRRNDLLQPFLKWAGGKRQLLPKIREYVPKRYNIYFEPFLGAGAVFFDLQPQEAILNDVNKELINCYQVIKTNPEELISLANEHRQNNSKEYFYRLRSLDREAGFKEVPDVERAARLIYLNKTCYNGLFRVNSQGQFNVPYGDYRDPQIVDDIVIRAVSRYLNEAQIEFSGVGFEDAVSGAERGDFVYLDPPYDPLSDTSSFTGYDLNAFGKQQQAELRDVCDALAQRGCYVLISNSATDFIRDLYSNKRRYTLVDVEANRSINSVSAGRGKINELLIFNNYNVR